MFPRRTWRSSVLPWYKHQTTLFFNTCADNLTKMNSARLSQSTVLQRFTKRDAPSVLTPLTRTRSLKIYWKHLILLITILSIARKFRKRSKKSETLQLKLPREKLGSETVARESKTLDARLSGEEPSLATSTPAVQKVDPDTGKSDMEQKLRNRKPWKQKRKANYGYCCRFFRSKSHQ